MIRLLYVLSGLAILLAGGIFMFCARQWSQSDSTGDALLQRPSAMEVVLEARTRDWLRGKGATLTAAGGSEYVCGTPESSGIGEGAVGGPGDAEACTRCAGGSTSDGIPEIQGVRDELL